MESASDGDPPLDGDQDLLPDELQDESPSNTQDNQSKAGKHVQKRKNDPVSKISSCHERASPLAALPAGLLSQGDQAAPTPKSDYRRLSPACAN